MGTNVDGENLSNTLKGLGFEVSMYKDNRHGEMLNEINAGEFDCIIKV